jgi:hypothetical protein
MIRNTLLASVFTGIIIAINLYSDVVHIPLLFIFIFALILGYLQPHKGWISALQLIVGIFVGFFWCQWMRIIPVKFTVFQFITYISPFPCLFGGFMGSYFSKTINQNDDRRSPKNR